ncbi:unnamed protein product [Prorocentrum cordatum]|uniref:Uncharacterized protein n=1 Tax=Prorocentrum cordatum TaxID=2364126 RepID=A0ABN9WD25_9DINO|nr:unnamed protein product [Polarella glacialis]
MAVPAFDESWLQDPILAGGVAPPCVPPTFGVMYSRKPMYEPMYSRKVGVVRARTPHPEDLGGLPRAGVASVEPTDSRTPAGAEWGGPERAMGALAEPDASCSPDSACADSPGAGWDASQALRGAIGAVVVIARRKLSGEVSAQKFSEITTETTPVAPASPPRRTFKFRARSYVRSKKTSCATEPVVHG